MIKKFKRTKVSRIPLEDHRSGKSENESRAGDLDEFDIGLSLHNPLFENEKNDEPEVNERPTKKRKTEVRTPLTSEEIKRIVNEQNSIVDIETKSCWACQQGFMMATLDGDAAERPFSVVIKKLIKNGLMIMSIDAMMKEIKKIYDAEIRPFYLKTQNIDIGSCSVEELKTHFFEHFFDVSLFIRKSFDDIKELSTIARLNSVYRGTDGSMKLDEKALKCFLLCLDYIKRLGQTDTGKSIAQTPGLTRLPEFREKLQHKA